MIWQLVVLVDEPQRAFTLGQPTVVAAAVILASAVRRFIHPVALERLGAGLAISTVATAVNGAVGLA